MFLKITVMSFNDPKDKRTWSGTMSNMYEALKRNGFEVDTITLKNWFTVSIFEEQCFT